MSFTVTTEELAETKVKVAALNKRAAKAGIAASVSVNVLSTESKTVTGEFGFDRTYTVHTAEFVGLDAVKLGDFTLAATLDHDVEGNIFRRNPGFTVEIPEEFRGTDATRCDHCHTSRRRNQTVLVYTEAEGFKQVGSDCVKLFLGVSPNTLIAFSKAMDELNDGEGGGWGRSAGPSTSEFIAAAALVTEVYGFKPAAFDGQSTKSVALALLTLTGQARRQFEKDCPELANPTEKNLARANKLAAEAREWVLASESKGSEYLLNLKIAAKRDELGKNAGLLASLPNSYKREMGQVAERAAKAVLPASTHVGPIGAKVLGTVCTVVYTNRSAPFSYYGPEGLFIILLNEVGNKFYLNTTVATAIGELLENAERGTKFAITGTVKSHKVTDKGEAVTVLTRCKAVGVLA